MQFANRLLFLFLAFLSTFPLLADDVLLPSGSLWKYLDDGSDQGSGWYSVAADDSAWKAGPAQLGYGDGDEQTVVGYGSDSNNKYVTTYFRTSFQVADASKYYTLKLRLLRDDGAIVYLNGNEIARSNMPSGAITYQTFAPSQLDSPYETTYETYNVANTLVTGANTIAVEVHQATADSSDISFDLELTGSDSVTVTRGPYLQMASSDSITVRWRTNVPSDSRVAYGLDPGALTSFTDGSAATTEHEVQLTGLLPATRYYYSIGTTNAAIAGGDPSYSFVTSPPDGVSVPTHIWVIGDSGQAGRNSLAVRDAYLNTAGSKYTNLWLMLGDNAYVNGTDTDYQAAVFDTYPSILRQTPLWPTFGNHDGISADSATQSGVYYDIFSLPKNGEAGGLPSGTEAYYSFDYGNIHFICLDSFESDRSSSGVMMTWLRNDIAQTRKQWVIAFWHHPPYSKGSHDSDTETALKQMRENALPILENAGVDLVLAGHSHSFERSFLIDGHYGTSSTFTSSMKKDGGSGREDGSGSYKKATDGMASHEGAVYVVAGSSSEVSTSGTLNHPAMYISLRSLGSMVLDVEGSRLDAKFIDNTGAIKDYFTIVKGVAPAVPPPPSPPPALPAPTNLTGKAMSSTRIQLNWTDNSTTESGFYLERSTDGQTFVKIVTLSANTVSYLNSGLSAGKTYYYRIRAYNATATSSYSNTLSAQTLPLPAAPSNLVTTRVSSTKIALTWTDNATDETGFKIQRSTDGVNFKDVKTAGANVVTYTNSVSSGVVYYYRVRAYRTLNGYTDYSVYSNIASGKT